MTIKFFYFFFILSLISCGKSKDEQAQDFYKEKLRTDEQNSCNEKGFFFDFSEEGSAACTSIPLAKFECNDANVKAELQKAPGSESALKEIQELVNQGFTYHQCGRGKIPSSSKIPKGADNGLAVIWILKGKSDTQATLSYRLKAWSLGSASASLSELL